MFPSSLSPNKREPNDRLFANRLAKGVIGLAFLGLAVNWVFAVGRYQVNVLYWDQWGFFTAIAEQKGWWGIFDHQHGPHRQGLAFLITSWIMDACHWDERVDSLWICGVLFLAALLGLLLKRRMVGPLRAGDAWIVLAILTLGQIDSVITTPNASHSVFPLLLMLCLAHLWLSRNVSLRYTGSALCNGALLFTGFGMFAAAVSTVFIGLAAASDFRAGRTRSAFLALAALLFTAIACSLFLHGYVFDPASPGFRFPWTPVTDYVRFFVLMLTAPAGWEGATFLHYVGGVVGIVLVAAAMGQAFRAWRKDPTLASPSAVTLLMALSTLVYCAYTAVGRVHMGASGGLTSRYITLVTPAFLGVYLWAVGRNPKGRFASLAVLWSLVLWPYFSLIGRPAADWMGSLGESTWIFERVRSIRDQKLAFVTAYLQDGDARRVARQYHARVIPEEMLDYLEVRLAYQRRHQLSFFSHPEEPFGYAPWFQRYFLSWTSGFPAEGPFRWMGREAELELGARTDGYLNFRVLQRAPGLPADAKLQVQIEDEHADLDFNEGLGGVSLPIHRGVHGVQFESLGGTSVPGGRDTRELSFAVSEPVLAKKALYVPWQPSGPPGTLAPAYAFEIVSGFYGWEDQGTLGWMSDRLELSVKTSVPVFLNVTVSGRMAQLPVGPLGVSVGKFRKELEYGHGELSFSLALAPGNEVQRITVTNSTGAARPSQFSNSADDRLLALKLARMSVDQTPCCEPLNGADRK